jgi:hypothetical protein
LLYLSRGNFFRRKSVIEFIKSKKYNKMFPHLINEIKIIERSEFKDILYKNFLNYSDEKFYKIMLIEGYSGCGKTTFF